MREIWVLFALVAFVSAAHATPSPLPPGDFPGDQYIDGQGCVYNREGTQWKARLDNSGKKLCGFPPSLDTRRTDPDTQTVLAPLHPPQTPDPESLLRATLAEGLRQGELTADPRLPEARSEGQLPQFGHDVAAQVRGLLEARQAIRAETAGALPASGICAQLGYRIVTDTGPIIGGDVTQGLCPGMRADLPSRRIVAAKRVEQKVLPENEAEGGFVGTEKTARPAFKSESAVSRTSRRPSEKSTPQMSTRIVSPEMIPASARYVEIGVFADDRTAGPAIRGLAEMGYPVAKGRRPDTADNPTVILAGPFNDRRSVVAALNLLRSRGYEAVAR